MKNKALDGDELHPSPEKAMSQAICCPIPQLTDFLIE